MKYIFKLKFILKEILNKFDYKLFILIKIRNYIEDINLKMIDKKLIF